MSKLEDVQKQKELISLKVTEKMLEEIVSDQYEKFSKVELAAQGQFLCALAYIQGSKALLSIVDKEKAKKAMADSIYDAVYGRAKGAAMMKGNPKDLKSYVEFEMSGLMVNAFIPPCEVLEESENRLVYGLEKCPFADGLRYYGELYPEWADKDVLEVAQNRCSTLDTGRAEGWNPDMKYVRVQYQLADLAGEGPADRGCFYEMEVSE